MMLHEPLDEEGGGEPAGATEYAQLRAVDSISAGRIAQLELTASERDIIALSVRKMNDLGTWAETYRLRGSRLFATHVLCAAAVPVLIALLGSFGDSWIDFAVRVLAIVLSIASTASRAIEDAYDWRAQAAIRRHTLTRMRLLFDNFCVLSGELFDPEFTGEAMKPKANGRSVGSSGMFASTAAQRKASSVERLMLRSPQAQLAAALDELRNHHSGANVRRYVVAFSALEDDCSERLTRIYDRNAS